MSKLIDLTGQTFGRLKALCQGVTPDTTKAKEKFWLCQCECGNQTTVSGYQLRSGKTQSCGCITKERMKKVAKEKPSKKHGLSSSRVYKNYYTMKARCYNPNHQKYEMYGAKGIMICSEWLGENGFLNFYEWAMNNGYQENLTIDRINNDGNYEPSNCRWTNSSLQGFNRHTPSNNSTGYVGISQLKNGKFRAYIKKDGKQISLGWHDTIEAAIEARQKAEKELFE